MRSPARGRLDALGRAALSYVAVVFAAGFLLGTARVLLTAPRFGELAGVALEAPIMLAVSWLACGFTLCAFDIQGPRQGALVGATAFAILMLAELALATLAFGRSPGQFLRAFGAPAGALGLLSQVAFGVFPLLRSGWPRRA